MKKLLLLVPVILVLLVSGCTTYDPEEIVKDSMEKMASLNSYKAEYDMSISTRGMGIDFTVSGEADVYKKGDKTRTDVSVTMMGQSGVGSTYQLPSGTYTCSESLGEMTCTKSQGATIMSPEESLEMNEKMIGKEVINLKFNNIATMAGRSCYNITSEFDLSKLSQLGQEDLEDLGEFGQGLLQGMSYLEMFTQLSMTLCYDFETGMPLGMDMWYEIDTSKIPQSGLTQGKASMSLSMTAKSFEPNAVIEDSVFELPVEPAVVGFCTDPDTGISMSYVEARAIALASNCTAGGDLIEGTEFCNDFAGSWWIDLDLEMEGCSPACVIDVADGTAEINWRCTGLLPE